MNDKERNWAERTILIRKIVLLSLLIIPCILIIYIIGYFSYFHVDFLTDNYNWGRVAQMAVEENKPTECSKIRSFKFADALWDATSYEAHIEYCYERVSELATSNAICQKFPEDRQRSCIDNVAEVAWKKAGIAGCETNTNGRTKGQCYRYFFENSRNADPSVCERLPMDDYTGRQDCYLGLAGNLSDISICDVKKKNVYSSVTQINECYLRMSTQSTDIKICDKIPLPDKDICYSRIAANNNDGSICDLISEGNPQGGADKEAYQGMCRAQAKNCP